ncbi:hypothetical protein [Sporosarcina cyprini]|uniref:hypothetical protein n=1 Tax=Sporosarcina cyprini TaxID=2910523 RepID=UPI001EDFDABA|nr:hypothetical protein [Sporosarcina cyprini]MCG3088238.1 hypothetical protein [Sporosarcina cyprini]
MKIRLGVVGARDSIGIVRKVVKEFHEIIMLPFPYDSMEEVLDIIPKNRLQVDQWFFAGQAPYHLAVDHQVIRAEEGSYAPLNSSSIYKTLLQAQLQENRIFHSISLDTFQGTESELRAELPSMELHTFPYSGYIPVEEIVKFHLELFEQGKVEVVITCIKRVDNILKDMGIPCYRVAPDENSIRLIIQYLKQRGVSQWYRKAQIAITGIEVLPSTVDEQFSYKVKYRELELKRLLLEYAESVNGSFVEMGDSRYFIYATRGEVELQLKENSLFTLINQVDLRSRFAIKIGVGYGITSLESEQNTRLAIQYARSKQAGSIITVDENKKVSEIEQQEYEISYDGRSLFEEWGNQLKEANISSATLNRIHSLALHYRKMDITSNELATWMNSTDRNARRILMELESAGLVEIKGEEQSGQRGRPRKVYRLGFLENEKSFENTNW